MSYDFSQLVGKTISHVEHHMGEYLPGMVSITLCFTDGDSIELSSQGCDEGGWINVPQEFYK